MIGGVGGGKRPTKGAGLAINDMAENTANSRKERLLIK
jgi:hypothetical protein